MKNKSVERYMSKYRTTHKPTKIYIIDENMMDISNDYIRGILDKKPINLDNYDKSNLFNLAFISWNKTNTPFHMLWLTNDIVEFYSHYPVEDSPSNNITKIVYLNILEDK